MCNRRKMTEIFVFLLMMTCISSTQTTEINRTIVELSTESEDETEQELSAQLKQIDVRNGGWTAWSKWSSCSRSCDGGVAKQMRTCKRTPCRGEHVRYKICNMQACPETSDFRDDQCAAFNRIPYNGRLYDWSTHPTTDERDDCALTCAGRPSGDVSDNDVLLVVRLAERVHDGTRCRPGSLDMCIEGKCKSVGCDLRIDSGRQVDECGVCGGDGSSCSRPLYHWTFTYVSLCSATCGGGYKMSRPVCQNRLTGDEVDEQLCNDAQKPNPTLVQCNTHNCPPKWHAGEWTPCSTSCGGGTRQRQVYCVEEGNVTKIMVDDERCPSSQRPYQHEACNEFDCPEWMTSAWSGCSVSCGEGLQVRVVECRDSADRQSHLCPLHTKPSTDRSCSTGIRCPIVDEEDEDEAMPAVYHTQPLVQPYPPPARAERLVDEQVPKESTFIADEWGPCSVTCGEGERRRKVTCKIFLEFSRTIATLPDKQCDGPKPPETEVCYREPCTSERIDVKDDPYRTSGDIKVAGGTPGKSYSWREQGYTHCSATCLGGVQELIVNCVRDDNQKMASPFLCPIELKPEVLMRTCNDHPCPPRWNYSEFSACSHQCGIGIQTREVNCIHEVTQGGGNTVVVPNHLCPQPPPLDRQYCNVLDCTPAWETSEWSRCTRSCGGGVKTRTVKCRQVKAQNHTVDWPDEKCVQPRPLASRVCNTKSCATDSDRPTIDVSNSSYIQHDFNKKKLSLKVGGAASVFVGTTIKIKCPVKRFDRSKIEWFKERAPVPKEKKYKILKKGALRVQNLSLRDSGLYTCVAGKSSAGIQISVRPRPGEFPTSEEIQRQAKHTDLMDADAGRRRDADDSRPPTYGGVDDRSHEQRPDGGAATRRRPTPKARPAPPPTVPSLILDETVADAVGASPKDQEQTSSHLPAGDSNRAIYETSAKSASSRVMPHFQQLIVNLQTFSNSRGHRMIAPTNENDDTVIVLGRGSADQLQFEWITDEWTECEPRCDTNAISMRRIECTVRLHNASQKADNNLCEDAGLAVPETVRGCQLDADCPGWHTGDWSPCEASKCFAEHRALQKRAVKCLMGGNRTLPSTKCNANTKPDSIRQCINDKCVGKWKVGSWSECTAPCGRPGVKYRIIQCVWFGTKKPAGIACKNLARPPVMKACKGAPCTSISECKDHSMFCPNVKTMNMCKVQRYRQQCCITCNQS